MSLFYQHNINENTRLGIWKIEEPEEFFLSAVPLQREITHPHKRLQHLAGRYLLKDLFPDFPYEEILIADTRKPYLPYEQYHFSISHCGDYAAAIVSRTQRVGIDIEIPTERMIRISKKFLNNEEQKIFSHFLSKSDSRDSEILNYHLLTVLWSAKEAVYKWWGWGNVDFSEHIRLSSFYFHSSGTLRATFVRPKERISLSLQYRMFEKLCLVWLNNRD